MDARELFGVGDRVVMAEDGIRMGLNGQGPVPLHGEVVGFARNPELVSVKPEHRKTASTYHVNFWTHDNTNADSAVNEPAPTEA